MNRTKNGLLAGLIMILGVVGCERPNPDLCRRDADCSGGYICDTTQNPAQCVRPPFMSDGGTSDDGNVTDGSPMDMGSDGGERLDMGTPIDQGPVPDEGVVDPDQGHVPDEGVIDPDQGPVPDEGVVDPDQGPVPDEGVIDPDLGPVPDEGIVDPDQGPMPDEGLPPDAEICDPSPEVCDGEDNDCDGDIDEDIPFGGPCTEGVGACLAEGQMECIDGVMACNAEPGEPFIELCNGIDDDCDGLIDNRDFPDEVCDGVDNDCDGDIDEDVVYPGPPPGVDALDCTCNQLGPDQQDPICRGDAGWHCRVCPPPDCIPEEEMCDGEDNDCDGDIDEDFDNLGDPCQVGVGACANAGAWVCNNAQDGTACDAVPGFPEQEICDGLDNDCDGDIDNGVEDDLGDVCDSGEPGICSAGIESCVDGQVACMPNVEPAEEVCNGMDDDCNGSVDDVLGVGDDCNTGLAGLCAEGVRECNDEGGLVCRTVVHPGEAEEICNGIDDNCDGMTDEMLDMYEECVVEGAAGICAQGFLECRGEEGFVCVGWNNPGDNPEMCDGLDNDCDGVVDNGVLNACGECGPVPIEICDGVDNDCDGLTDNEDVGANGEPLVCECQPGAEQECYTGPPNTAGVGICRRGIQRCNANGAWGPCNGTLRLPEELDLCDGLDNDCDGDVDEGPDPRADAACETGQPGQCAAGVNICMGGEIRCMSVNPPIDEICDGLDNDCNGDVDDLEICRCPSMGGVQFRLVPVSGGELCVALTETTVTQYAACNAPGCTATVAGQDCNTGVEGRDNDPVNCITKGQIEAFCASIDARLPTLDEWQDAAYGADRSRNMPMGDEVASCNFGHINGQGVRGCGTNRTAPVGSYSPNGDTPEGLQDMLGNVSEFVQEPMTRVGCTWYSAPQDCEDQPVRQDFPDDGSSPVVGGRCVRAPQ